MMRNRRETWAAVAVAVIGLVAVTMLVVWSYILATAPVHGRSGEIPSSSQGTSPRWTEAIRQSREAVRSALLDQNLPGLSVAVGYDGAVVWAEGSGWADLDQRQAVTPELRFRIGTASVALTSAAAGLLIEDGRLMLDRGIGRWVPEASPQFAAITLRQLMESRSGIRNDGGDESPLYNVLCERPLDALPHLGQRSLLFASGSRFHRSNYDWILVSAAIDAAGDDPFMTFMRRHVFAPLGMDHTGSDAPETTGQATSYFPRVAANPRYGLHLTRPIELSCYAGAAAFVTTPSDLVRFGMAMVDGQLLQRTTTGLLLTPSVQTDAGDGVALGWRIETAAVGGQRLRLVRQDGEILGGQVSSLVLLPTRRLVVAAISNSSYAETSRLAVDIVSAFASASGQPGEP